MIRGEVTADRQPVVPLILRSGGDYRAVRVSAIVDPRFTEFVSLPLSLIQSLDLPLYETRPFRVDDNRFEVFEVYALIVEWDGIERGVSAIARDVVSVGSGLLYGSHVFIDFVDGGMVEITPRPSKPDDSLEGV